MSEFLKVFKTWTFEPLDIILI